MKDSMNSNLSGTGRFQRNDDYEQKPSRQADEPADIKSKTDYHEMRDILSVCKRSFVFDPKKGDKSVRALYSQRKIEDKMYKLKINKKLSS